MNTKNLVKYVGAGVVALGLGFAMGATLMPIEKTIVNEVIVPQEVIKEVPVEVVKEVQVEVPYNVTVEVPVDNGNLDIVLDYLYDNDGEVEYLLDDLDDDEVSLIVDRIVFINDIKSLAEDEVKHNIVDELDHVIVGDEELDDRDIERVKIDFDDIYVEDVDFEDGDADVFVPFTFEQDDVDYKGVALVKFKHEKIDDLSIENVELD